MKILLLSRYDRLGASSRLRSYQYLEQMRERGHKIDVAPLLSNYYLQRIYAGKRAPLAATAMAYVRRIVRMFRSASYDLIWIEYEALPWIPLFLESFLTKSGTPYVVDYDDAVFHRYDQHFSKTVRLLLGRKIDGVMRGSKLVIAGNEYIAQRAREAGAPHVEIVPTAVDLTRFSRSNPPRRSTFTIGWIGTPKTEHYLYTIREALRDVCQGGSSRLTTIGSSAIEMNGVPVETRPWQETTEAEELQRIDVGIMPIPDSPWEHGKSGYKLLQYMATARPVIASPVGVNRQIVQHGINGYLASSQEEWKRAFYSLRDDVARRSQMGNAGRQLVEQSYSTSVIAPRLISLLEHSVSRRN